MKKSLAILAISCFSFASLNLKASPPTREVNEKVQQEFAKTYVGATNVKWATDSDHDYVSFMLRGIQSRITYNSEGNLVSSLRYYDGTYLPMIIQNALAKKFPKKAIMGVTEATVIADDVPYLAFFVKMNDDRYWYTYKVSFNEDIERLEKFERADIGLK